MPTRKRRSILWTLPDTEFSAIVEECKSKTEVLAKFGKKNRGGNSRTLNERIAYLGLSVDHFEDGLNAARRKNTVPLAQRLTANSRCNGPALKRRLLAEGLLVNICSSCGQLPVWNNKPLVLQMDHINGDPTDNRLENLRILCPHCHSQTATFGRKSRTPRTCKCGKRISNRSETCRKCRNQSTVAREFKIEWPDISILVAAKKARKVLPLARSLGVSDSAVHKRIRKFQFRASVA